MAKIAVELEQALALRARNGGPGHLAARRLAQGEGWLAEDLVCTSGPGDRPFEERHAQVCIAIVAAGTFQYRSGSERTLMTPGSILLGSPGRCFECGHEHGHGDRCLSFRFTPERFERLAADAGVGGGSLDFRVLRLPPLRVLSPLVARACAGVTGSRGVAWEEIAIQLAGGVVRVAQGFSIDTRSIPTRALERVTHSVRSMENQLDDPLPLTTLAREAGLSPYHYLRTFERLTGVTPHQYRLRQRLRTAAVRLTTETSSVLGIALECGFGDASNFHRAFRAEFGVSPRAYRRRVGGTGGKQHPR